MRKLLLVLIDGCPYWRIDAQRTPYLASLNIGPLEPGLGFSVNLYPELLAGRQPDDLGFFNKWTLKPEHRRKRPSRMASVARAMGDWSRVSFPVSRIVHKLLERFLHTGSLGNVPFSYLPYFELSPKKEIFGTRTYPTIFHNGDWRLAIASGQKGGLGQRDARALEQARTGIREGKNVFLLLADLDATAHRYGMGRFFDRQLARVDAWCRSLTQEFVERHGEDGLVVFISDHGMQAVNRAGRVDLKLERNLGPAGPETYLYMLEAVMVRLWFFEPGLAEKGRRYLDSLGAGVILSDEERARYGVSDRAFADLIFMLDEGKVFYPSFFGGKFPWAVHGYHPAHVSQKGIVGCNLPGESLPTRAVEMFPFLQRILRASDAMAQPAGT